MFTRVFRLENTGTSTTCETHDQSAAMHPIASNFKGWLNRGIILKVETYAGAHHRRGMRQHDIGRIYICAMHFPNLSDTADPHLFSNKLLHHIGLCLDLRFYMSKIVLNVRWFASTYQVRGWRGKVGNLQVSFYQQRLPGQHRIDSCQDQRDKRVTFYYTTWRYNRCIQAG